METTTQVDKAAAGGVQFADELGVSGAKCQEVGSREMHDCFLSISVYIIGNVERRRVTHYPVARTAVEGDDVHAASPSSYRSGRLMPYSAMRR